MTYDCFMFNGEYDILEIRFNLLDEFVDKFVICESLETFSGKHKPLYWDQRDKERFKKWESKVIYNIPVSKQCENPFEQAAYQKDSIRNALIGCNGYDLIYYSDVDEIWTPQIKEGKLRQLSYSYYLNNRSSEDWQGTNVFIYDNIRNLNDIRADHSVVLENGGWHFTNVMPYDELIRKLESYDHQECNIPWVKDGLKSRIDNNVDYLGRTYDWKGNQFKMWIDESDLPEYILTNKDKWISKKLWK